ncbi:hypothetical protein DRO69_12200 [Candidatus Bathyarchaeota archaeon]|nr:MAG: hypothetical protein DRO69_12200 [Candidatus Bathyarchaeota archaeon]
MWVRIKETVGKVKQKRNDILILVLWSVLIAFMVVKTYWTAYQTANRLVYFKPAHPSYDLSNVNAVDLLIIAIASFIVGISLSDAKTLFYGYIFSLLLAFILCVIYISLYVWYVLDYGPLFSLMPYGWEWAFFIATSIVFALMFPWIFCICLVSLAVSSLLRSWITWS